MLKVLVAPLVICPNSMCGGLKYVQAVQDRPGQDSTVYILALPVQWVFGTYRYYHAATQ